MNIRKRQCRDEYYTKYQICATFSEFFLWYIILREILWDSTKNFFVTNIDSKDQNDQNISLKR